MTARSRERGSHAGRPRGYGLPFSVPGLSGLGALISVKHGGRAAEIEPDARLPPGFAPGPAGPGVPAAPGGPAGAPDGPGSWPGEPGPAGDSASPASPAKAPARRAAGRNGSRHRKAPGRRPVLSGRQRLVVVLVVAVGVLAVGFADGFGGAGSPEPTVQAFLYDWQTAHYDQAAALTNGGGAAVRTELAAAYTDLDASSAIFTMGRITQHGGTAVATYQATMDLAAAGRQWSYAGQFGLTLENGQWVVDWAPSVINPRLGAGDRLAVVTTYAPRAEVEDMNGQPLVTESADYQVGVYPGRLKSPAATAAGFSQLTGLSEQQVLGQIQAAPPSGFLSLLTLDPAGFRALWPKLAKVPGLTYQQRKERLFDSSAQDVVGQVGTEDSSELLNEGAAYQPGMTVGVGGLEQAYQGDLLGTPATSVVVVNAAGRDVATLWRSKGGHAGTPVRTTLSGQEQADAVNALAGQASSAEIVAVDASTGAIRVLASRDVPGSEQLPANGPLDAEVEPGMAFSIVSAAALLSTGVDANHPLPCEAVADVGGVTFTYQPAEPDTSTFATDFADGCGTAFANMSRTLTPQQLTGTERAFGIGSSWQLPLQSFSGSAPTVTSEADVAAQATGAGGVLMSPLGMATVAAEVAAGTGHSPVLIPTESSATVRAPLSGAQLSELRLLMRLAVTSGSAHAADVSGAQVYGQAGVVRSGPHSYLSWFAGYSGSLAVAVLETGSSASQAAAALAGTFFSNVSNSG